MNRKLTALCVLEAAIIAYMLLRREYRRRSIVFAMMEENRRQIELLKNQNTTAGDSVEAMLEENAQLRHKLAVEVLKFSFIQEENNKLRTEIYQLKNVLEQE